jgi:hypothetical protein
MLFLRTRFFIFFFILVTGLFLGGAVMGYTALTAHGDKAGAEQLLLYGLVVIAVFIFFSVRVFIYGKRAARKFDKILDSAKLRGQLPLDRLDYFGAFGANMRRLYQELSTLGERKSSRIQQQNLTINKLLEFIGVPLLVVDATGEIRKASGGFAEKYKISAAAVPGKPLQEFLAGLDFPDVLQEANRTKSAVELKIEKISAAFYPILSEKNDVSYFITVFGPHELKVFIAEEGARKVPLPGTQKKRFLGGLVDLIKRKINPSKPPNNEKP